MSPFRLLLPALLALAPPAAAAGGEPRTLGAGDALLLGVVEGVTEYLPVSSTGHLIITNNLLGLDSGEPLTGADGGVLYLKPPSPRRPGGAPLTRKLAADTFAVVIQFGAIAAVAFLYWRRLVSMARGLFGRDPEGLRLLGNLLVAFAPAAVFGLLAKDFIEERLFSVPAVIAALVAGAAAMLWAERWRAKKTAGRTPRVTTLGTLAPKQALGIGLLQCAALWPGMSRSMTTIVGGYLVRLEPREAAEFSFLLGLVTLTAATAYKTLESGGAMLRVFGLAEILLGCAAAAVTAALAVRFLVGYLARRGLAAFAIYRLLLAAALAAWLFWTRP
ncbi:MAG: undecaprenyl-diphosphate phosphatase [Opitutaceae bacterium]|jgi:undecaprenyl-diphosphatase|nr:undecaprenyl-diphosphate phosphatase [Opitutaceae bacterium]